MRKTVATGVAVAALAGGVVVIPPASAATPRVPCIVCEQDAGPGQLVLTFNKKTWKAIDAQMMVNATGKASTINVRSFGFPAEALDEDTIASKGGLAFVRADASLKMRKFVLDLANDSVAASIPGIGVNYDVFDLDVTKSTKKTLKAKANVAMGEADTLNKALKTDIFTNGMTIGRFTYTPG